MAKIVLLGDSITEGFPKETLMKEFSVVNKGVSGDRTDSILDRINKDVIDLSPDAVFLLIGTNDLTFTKSNNTLLVNYERIIFRITKNIPGVKLFVQSILPTRNLENRPLERIQLLNVEIHKLALKYGAKYLDLYPLFVDKKGGLSEEFSDDGLHLTDTAYAKWADYLNQIFVTML